MSEVEGVVAETNFVMFSERQSGVSGDERVMVINYVDKDDLYAYRSDACIRLDISAVIALKSYRCRVKMAGKEKEKHVIVITRNAEEKSELLEHIKELQNQVVFLQNRTNIVAWQEKDREQIETEINNQVLKSSVRQHQLRVLSAQSALSELTHSVNDRCPLDIYIHLGRDWAKRTETLTDLKAQQCQDAAELMEKRTQFMTEAREYTENAQFVDEAGNFCSIRFDITPLEGLKTVKDAFDVIQFHIKHMDTKPMNSKYTCTSEHGTDNDILHRRLIMSEVDDVVTETNFVMFSERRSGVNRHYVGGEPSKPHDQGVMVMNYVDKDDIYPYRSDTCVRLDISGVMALKSWRRLVKTPQGEEKEEKGVVLTRWMLQKLRHTALPVPTHVLQKMRDRINEPGNAILRAVKDARTPVQLTAKDIPVLGC
ncbi:hypothetical protein BBO99_00007788 [Phytophthora kernoviae]|uniref:Uncharacterized protein n=1 Tax=Phytophthora kernoviae TaxID=325452 RepID=A0A3R7H9D8_9STRA|nr:hypothetical protein JM16_007369 [Phytophthora kernoviae]RLN37459.1 hypothetical protein BBI17_007725 [Phytophthora kernoviae]RLN76138.1 hypothetical protein BBO99_00007788 [Phytophthora kernoviae]